ncbi:hypothetical protein B488_07610 [Liberibacter crescens BT-1]|uniref:Co-chaperone DjlA N-terminal domain-containing protein n=2 Tax=Liberibacter crescens TaxID=1273132 RepID=L0EVQ3_LIBCB|nr:hypothetical protein B488_07610 [Liberibacter crescens BT-1]
MILKVDGEISEKEISHFKSVLKKRYNLSEKELKSLLDAAKSAELEAIDYYRFTSNLKRHLNIQQRLEVIAVLRDLASIDGENRELEDDIVWRVADVFGIKDREFVINEENSPQPSLKAELVS